MKTILTVMLLTVAGSMTTKTHAQTDYTMKVGDFSELKVTDAINVDYKCSADSAGYVCFNCPSELASALILSSKGRTLTVQVSTEAIGLKNLPRVTVYSRFLTKVFNSGDSTVRVLSVADTPRFEASLENNGSIVVRNVRANEVKANLKFGHGHLVITGECGKAVFGLAGTGVIEADGLKADEVKISASGTGSIGVWAEKELSVYGVGSTSIYYKGNPEIKKRSIGMTPKPIQ